MEATTKYERMLDYRDELIEQAAEIALAQEITEWRCVIEGTISPDDPILSSADIARETGWGGAYSGISMPHDRARGGYYPFFRTEMELAGIKAIGRILATKNETGRGIVENIKNYTVGDEGIALEWKAIDKSLKDDERIKRAQQVLDLFLRKNKVIIQQQMALLEELIPAGEAMIILRPHADGVPRCKVRSADHLAEPSAGSVDQILTYHGYEGGLEDGLDWSFGVATPAFEYDDVRGYCFVWYGVPDNWEYLPASQVVHAKVNVPADVKRGLNDFYAVYANIERAGKGFGAAGDGATLQASIAYIEKFKQGTPKSAAEDAIATPATFMRNKPGRMGLIPVRTEQVGAGRILKTDRDVMYGPLGAPQGAKLIEVFQAILRRVGTRFAMPEWMISGDASNNNMASSITAGSAFDVASQVRQKFIGDLWIEAAEKAMALMGVDVDELHKIARLTSAASQVASRDEEVDENIRAIRKQNGILSPQTWAQEVGLDYEEEQANIAAAAPPPMAPGMDPNNPNADPNAPPGGAPGGNPGGGGNPPGSDPRGGGGLGGPRAEGLAFSAFDTWLRSVGKTVRERDDDEAEVDDGDHWVTIHGSPVLIGGDGEVKSGPLKGMKLGGDHEHHPKNAKDKVPAGKGDTATIQKAADAPKIKQGKTQPLGVALGEMKPETVKRIKATEKAYPPADPEANDTYFRHITREGNHATAEFTPERKALHDKLVEEVTAHVPKAPEARPEFVLMGGGPSAGKSSSVASGDVELRQHTVRLNVDDDFKFKLPEYKDMHDTGDTRAARFVHEESSHLAKRAMASALKDGKNVILDGTGDAGIDSVKKKIAEATAAGHDVRAVYATNSIDNALRLSQKRGEKSGRFVPESLLVHTHKEISKNMPAMIEQGVFPHLEIWDTNASKPGPDGKPVADPRLVLRAKGSKVLFKDEGLYKDFLDKVHWQGPLRREAIEGGMSDEGVSFERRKQIYYEVMDGKKVGKDTAAEAAVRKELTAEVEALRANPKCKSIEFIQDWE